MTLDARQPVASNTLRPSAWACLLSVLLLLAFPAWARQTASVPAGRKASNVAIIPIEGEIDAVAAYSFSRRLQIAEQGGADAVVVEIDSPGGELGAVFEITDAIRSSSIPNIVAWINPNAFSGGAIIAIACREIIVAERTRFGDALPIAASRTPWGMQVTPLPPEERQKALAPLVFEVVGSARARGWDEFVVQGFVALGVELWWVRDPATGETFAINEAEYRMLFEGEPTRVRPRIASVRVESAGAPAPDVAPPDAAPGYLPASPSLESIDFQGLQFSSGTSRRVITPADKGRFELVDYLCTGDSPLVLDSADLAYLGFAANVDAAGAPAPVRSDADVLAFFGASNLRRLDPSISEAAVRVLTNPITRGVLIVCFLVALFIEMTHPGMIVPASVAVVSLLFLLAPPTLLGLANWWEIGAIVAGVLLLAMEVLVIPGFGVPGVLGLLLLFGGLLGTFVGPTSGGLFPDSPQEQTNLLYGLVTLILSTVTAIAGMYFLAKHFGSIPLMRGLVLAEVSGQPSAADDTLLASIPLAPGEAIRAGATGVAITPLRPSGRAQFGERIVDVSADLAFIDAGTAVRVIAVEGLRVVVEAAPRENA